MKILDFCLFLWLIFCPPGSGSTFKLRIRIRIQEGKKWSGSAIWMLIRIRIQQFKLMRIRIRNPCKKSISFKSFIMQHTHELEDWKSLHNWSCWQVFFINLKNLVSLQKTLRVLYKLSRFLKELGQKRFLILLSAVSPDLCQELWGEHCFVVSSVLSSVCKMVLWRAEIRELLGRKSTNCLVNESV